jgi:transposase
MEELYQLFPFTGYKVRELRVQDDVVRVFLDRLDNKPMLCHTCGSPLKNVRNRQRRSIEDMRILDRRTFVHFTQLKGRCPQCRKVRIESVDFISHESPHLTRRYAFLLGRLCEIAPVSRVADLMGHGKMTLWRVELERMERYFKDYKLPEVLTHLSVDEVYARSNHNENETRNDQFFTVITDLRTHKVVWVEQSRSRAALDRFFEILGPEKCSKMVVIATDQHEEYSKSIKAHCLNAIQVFDRFHLMKAFEEAVNDTRKVLYKMLPQSAVRELAKGKYRFVFLKADSKRTEEEKTHMEKVMKDNEAFIGLELIKERMLTFFDQKDAQAAADVFNELGEWIFEAGFPPLKAWWKRCLKQWATIANYFTYRVTTALSEGVNNVIKSVKRAAFGFRNMDYFKLKILQRCGLLNSQYMTDDGNWTSKARALLGYT